MTEKGETRRKRWQQHRRVMRTAEFAHKYPRYHYLKEGYVAPGKTKRKSLRPSFISAPFQDEYGSRYQYHGPLDAIPSESRFKLFVKRARDVSWTSLRRAILRRDALLVPTRGATEALRAPIRMRVRMISQTDDRRRTGYVIADISARRQFQSVLRASEANAK